jgi:elongation factor P
MLEYNEITLRKYILLEGQPYEVLDSHVFRKQQRKPVNATKLKNLITGNIKEVSFHVSEKVEEAELGKRDIKYLYSNRGQHWFGEINDPTKRFMLPEELVGAKIKFMKQNSLASALIFDENIIGVEVPIKVDLKVTEAFPAVMFITEGEVIRINTETEQYVERVGGNKF